MALCDGALLLCNIHDLSFHKSTSANILASWRLNNIPYSSFRSAMVIENNCQHDLKFRVTTQFLEVGIVFKAPFRRLLACLHVVLVNPCIITNYDAFYAGGVRRGLGNHVLRDQLSMFLLDKMALSEPVVERRVSCPKYQS